MKGVEGFSVANTMLAARVWNGNNNIAPCFLTYFPSFSLSSFPFSSSSILFRPRPSLFENFEVSRFKNIKEIEVEVFFVKKRKWRLSPNKSKRNEAFLQKTLNPKPSTLNPQP